MQLVQTEKFLQVYTTRLYGNVWLRAFLIVLGVFYLLQLYSPLRLTSDAITFLSIAASVADGNGFEIAGKWVNRYPPGYIVMVAGLDIAGLGSSWAFTALNCFFIALGLFVCYFIFRNHFRISQRGSLLICCFTLLSYIFVKQVTFPMSDIPFFGVAIACLYVLVLGERAQGRRKWMLLVLAAFLAVTAISIRTIGIALIPALLWAVPSKSGLLRKWWATGRSRRSHLAVSVLLIGFSMLVTGFLITRTEYFDIWRTNVAWMDLSTWLTYFLRLKFEEMGELIVNFPPSKMYPAIAEFVEDVLPFIGFVGLIVVLLTIWRTRQYFGVVEVFFLAYLLIRFLWPGYDPRFWIPVIPLMMGWCVLAVRDLLGSDRRYWVRYALGVFAIWYALVGLGALAYTSHITFSGSRFPEVYKEGLLKSTYRAAYTGVRTTEEVNERAYKLLLRYESRVHPELTGEPAEKVE